MTRHPAYLRPCLALLTLIASASLSGAQPRWQFEAGGKIIGKPIIAGDTLHVAGGRVVHALSLEGEQLWRRELPGEIAASVVVAGDAIYVHSSSGLHALDTQGAPTWTYENEDLGPLVDGRTWGWGNEILADPWGWYRSAPLVRDGVVLFGSSDGVHAVGAQTGEKKWHVPIGPVTADLVAYEDTIVVASWNDSVYGLDATTGKLRWRFRARPPTSRGVDWAGYFGFHLSPVLHGEHVFVGTRGTFFFAIDASDGTEVWSSKVGSSWIGSPAAVSDDAVYYGLSDGMAVLGYERKTGAQTLFFNTGALVFAQPELHGTDLVVGTLSGHLFVIDTPSGRGEKLATLGPDEVRYAEFFQEDRVPDGLTRYEATIWSIDQILTQANAILNLEVHEDVAYVGTGSGTLYAVPLDPSE